RYCGFAHSYSVLSMISRGLLRLLLSLSYDCGFVRPRLSDSRTGGRLIRFRPAEPCHAISGPGRSAHPIVSRPMAAIQLPATRAAIFIECARSEEDSADSKAARTLVHSRGVQRSVSDYRSDRRGSGCRDTGRNIALPATAKRFS